MEAGERVRVAVVNDYVLVVAGVASVLSAFADRVEVVEVDSAMPVLSDVDVVLYDTFGQAQGGDLRPDAMLAGSQARLLVFSWNTDRRLVEDSLAAGAHGYVAKSASPEELVAAIEAVARGDIVRPPSADEEPVDGDVGRWPGDREGLSPREGEVLALICQGLSNEQVGQRAFLGKNTVKSYVRSLYRKIGVESRTQAVLWGIDHGFARDHERQVVSGAAD
ncbi:LuxR C-terminal-related transcriptional regulator [Nocardioides acrostichi]|uniref:Response regulator transcription factor n=1 Tax=Nocardioides acrostichi TaxID=2784339 RepID=A0A930UYW2_9ACTN|nr:response regulator transcription factor [Nocardioides acrostichi]MBF4161590.1 response regulator transcription factor [Nocardioides acrostichi]